MASEARLTATECNNSNAPRIDMALPVEARCFVVTFRWVGLVCTHVAALALAICLRFAPRRALFVRAQTWPKRAHVLLSCC